MTDQALLAIFAMIVCALANRVRGDDTWIKPLPGRGLFYMAPVVGLVAWLCLPQHALQAAYAGLAFLVWGLMPWGRWYTLQRLPKPAREPDWFERAIESVSFGSDHLAFFIRNLMIVPGLVLIQGFEGVLVGVCMAALIVAAYELAWRCDERFPIPTAELFTGALWGALLTDIGRQFHA